MKKTAARGHVRKHSKAATHKHHAVKAKHHPTAHQLHVAHMQHLGLVHAKAKHPAHAKAKALALAPDDVGCCTIEALEASLRLQGLFVADSDVLDLFRLAGGDEEKGMPVRVALEAAAGYGLGGYRLAAADPGVQVTYAGLAVPDRPLILGLDLGPGHAVLATPQGWWSWGELWCPCEFPDAVIDEAWAVEWAVAG